MYSHTCIYCTWLYFVLWQVAQNEAALQSEVQHYKRMVGDLRREMEQLRMQPPPPPLAPAVDHHEMSRLRGEVG